MQNPVFLTQENYFFRAQYKNTETERLMLKTTNQWYFTYYLPWWNCVWPWELFLTQIRPLILLCYHGDANQGTRQPASCEQVNNKLSVADAIFRLCLRYSLRGMTNYWWHFLTCMGVVLWFRPLQDCQGCPSWAVCLILWCNHCKNTRTGDLLSQSFVCLSTYSWSLSTPLIPWWPNIRDSYSVKISSTSQKAHLKKNFAVVKNNQYKNTS